MKSKVTKLSEAQATLILSGISCTVIILLSLLGLIWNQPGWVIGAGIGSVACVVSVLLSEKSADLVLKDQKPGLYLLCYFGKMLLFVALFGMLVIFQFVCHFETFINSCFGFLIAYAPTMLISIVIQLRHKGEKETVNNNGEIH